MSVPELAAQIDLTCPRCGIARRYEGLHDPASARELHEYACPRCGSVELFRPGLVEHPLPGAAE